MSGDGVIGDDLSRTKSPSAAHSRSEATRVRVRPTFRSHMQNSEGGSLQAPTVFFFFDATSLSISPAPFDSFRRLSKF